MYLTLSFNFGYRLQLLLAITGEPVLTELVRAVHETAAVRMLRAMGWKEGQGIGDRVTSKEKKKAKEQHKVYGCYIPEDLRQVRNIYNTEHYM